MKIGFINIYQNKVDRGAESYIKELSSRLSKDFEVEVIASNELPKPNWPFLWRFFVDPKGLQILLFTLRKVPYLFRRRFDVVVPVNGGWQPAIVRLITWIYGGKMQITGHSGEGWDDRNNLWCFPDIFVTTSSRQTKWAKRVNPFVKIVEIPIGIDTDKFSPNGPKQSLSLKKPIILSVGAITDSKRLDLAIKAVSKIKNASLVICGSGINETNINLLGKKLLGERFVLINLPYSEMPKIYRSADIFTLPSKAIHSFEIVLLEAMATNIPVVANKDEVRSQIVGRGGLVVDPTKIDDYAAALQQALKKKWGNIPRNRAQDFSWNDIGQRYVRLYNSFIRQ